MPYRSVLWALAALLPLAACAPQALQPPTQACGLVGAGEARVTVQLLFGRAIGTQGEVSEDEWQDFLAKTVTPAFPDGLTVFDAQGQWRDTATGAIVGERSKVVLVLVANVDAAMKPIAAVADVYKRRFQQQAVRIVSQGSCVVFR